MRFSLLVASIGWLSISVPASAQLLPPMRLADTLTTNSAVLSNFKLPVTKAGTYGATAIRIPLRSSGYRWDPSSGQWSAPTLEVSSYDTEGRRTLFVQTDSVTQKPIVRVSDTYELDGRLTHNLLQVWDGANWQNDQHVIYSYNAQGRSTETLKQRWKNGDWVNEFQVVYSYNSQGSMLYSASRDWINGAWVTRQEVTSTFNSANRLTEQISSVHDAATNQLIPLQRRLYQYTGTTNNGIIAQIWANMSWQNATYALSTTRDPLTNSDVQETLQWSGTDWRPDIRTTTTYSPRSGNIVHLREKFTNNFWSNDTRTTSYIAPNKYIGGFIENWKQNAWVETSGNRMTRTINASNDLVSELYEQFDAAQARYINTSKTRYYDFQSITLATRSNTFSGQATIYPNPTHGAAVLILDGLRTQATASIEVINSLGQVVSQTHLQPQSNTARHSFDLTNLPAGVYLVRTTTADGMVAKRLIKQ